MFIVREVCSFESSRDSMEDVSFAKELIQAGHLSKILGAYEEPINSHVGS